MITERMQQLAGVKLDEASYTGEDAKRVKQTKAASEKVIREVNKLTKSLGLVFKIKEVQFDTMYQDEPKVVYQAGTRGIPAIISFGSEDITVTVRGTWDEFETGRNPRKDAEEIFDIINGILNSPTGGRS